MSLAKYLFRGVPKPSVLFVGSSNIGGNSTTVIPVPASAEDGDLVLMVTTSNQSTTSPPAGFSNVISTSAHKIGHKILSGETSFNVGSMSLSSASLAVFRNAVYGSVATNLNLGVYPSLGGFSGGGLVVAIGQHSTFNASRTDEFANPPDGYDVSVRGFYEHPSPAINVDASMWHKLSSASTEQPPDNNSGGTSVRQTTIRLDLA